MSDEKPWLDKTHSFRHHVLNAAGQRVVSDVDTWARAKLIAAAPQLARALALAEFADGYKICPVCDAKFEEYTAPREHTKHHVRCPLDAALTAAGLDTAEKREEARRAER